VPSRSSDGYATSCAAFRAAGDRRTIGHLHDVRAERSGGELVIVDYLVGPAAFLERISVR
jgi:hypothetical protein